MLNFNFCPSIPPPPLLPSLFHKGKPTHSKIFRSFYGDIIPTSVQKFMNTPSFAWLDRPPFTSTLPFKWSNAPLSLFVAAPCGFNACSSCNSTHPLDLLLVIAYCQSAFADSLQYNMPLTLPLQVCTILQLLFQKNPSVKDPWAREDIQNFAAAFVLTAYLHRLHQLPAPFIYKPFTYQAKAITTTAPSILQSSVAHRPPP